MPSGCSNSLTGHHIWPLTTSPLPKLTPHLPFVACWAGCPAVSREQGAQRARPSLCKAGGSGCRCLRCRAPPCRAVPLRVWPRPADHLRASSGLSPAFSALSAPCLPAALVPSPGWGWLRLRLRAEGPPCCLGAIFRLRGASAPAPLVAPQASSRVFLLSPHGTWEHLRLKVPPATSLWAAHSLLWPLCVSQMPHCHVRTCCCLQAASGRCPSELLLFLFGPLP